MVDPVLVQRLFPGASDATRAAFAEQAPSLFKQFELTNAQNRLFFFLAQIAYESNGLRVTSENLNYSAARLTQVWPKRFPNMAATIGYANNPEALANLVYGNRLGNTAPGDGYKYRGRGFIQLTGKDNYAAVGAVAKLDLVNQPDLAAAADSALHVSCAYWDWRNLNPICDQGDFVTLTQKINGGTVGLQDRYRWLSQVQDIVPWPLPGITPADTESGLPVARIKAIQLKLQSLNLYHDSIDGILGEPTRAALKTFQMEQHLDETGTVTDATLAALKV
ncbi:peptidoglycan-binding protein [Ahniella affigens]|nr:peptidoglycan-binding protein [Ahniella affigens]